MPSRTLPHKAPYKCIVFCKFILDYLQSDSQLIYVKEDTACSVDSVLCLYHLWALHSYCFVGYCHCYCHLDFNVMICKPLLIMQYLSKIRCCSSYCINEFICGKEYLLPFFPFNIWNFFRTKSKLWVLNQESKREGNSTALFSLINQLHNSMK